MTKPKKPRPTLQEQLHNNIIWVMVGVAVASATVTAGITAYWASQISKNQEQISSIDLVKAKKDLQDKFDTLSARLLSIERHVGDKSIWDLSSIIITSTQGNALAKEYKYYDQFHCYLATPTSSNWNFTVTNEWQFMKLMYGSALEPENTAKLLEKDRAILERLKTSGMLLWTGPSSFQVATNDPTNPTIHVFPFVFIQELSYQELSKAAGEVNLSQTNEAATALRKELEDKNPQRNEIAEKLSGILNSDSAGFFLSRVIRQGFELSNRVPDSSFSVLDAEKKLNVFYLHGEFRFSKENIYWEREYICIGTGKSTIFVTTSAPWSPEQRFTEGAWVASFLAGIRVPVDPR